MKGLSILVIEDEPTTRNMLQRLLDREGHSTVAASNGLEGIDIFKRALSQRKPFDLVITDYGMPQMNGVQVAKTIKSLSPSTPIIMVSGWESVSSVDSDSTAAVDFHLNKPVTNQELCSAIKQVMRKCHSQ